MSFDTVVAGPALVGRPPRLDRVEVAVADGRIARIAPEGSGLAAAERIELAPDEVLIPGLVDTHVHVNEPGRTEWEGFASATRAAAAGGVTTIIDMPLNSIPPTLDPDALALKRTAAAGQSSVDVGFWGGVTPSNLGSLRALHDAGVFGFKCFLAPSGVEEFACLDAAGLAAAADEISTFGGLLIVHAEDPGILDAAEPPRGGDYAAYVASRPDAAETVAIEGVIAQVRRTGVRAHILHLSSTASLPALRAARAEGLPITVETCPHYLTLDADGVPEGGTHFKCAPPIRDTANRDALWEALRAGDIDLVVSDHSPSTADLKFAGGGDFGAAWGGIAGLQVGFAAVWTDARRRGIPLAEVVTWMATRPAALAGLGSKGAIEEGADADLVVLAPDAAFEVRAAALEHRNPVSAYDGQTLVGVVRRTLVGGSAPGSGRLLSRPDPTLERLS